MHSAGRQIECVAMPLKDSFRGPAGGEQRIGKPLGIYRVPADFLDMVRIHPRAESFGQQFVAEADAQDRKPDLDGCAATGLRWPGTGIARFRRRSSALPMTTRPATWSGSRRPARSNSGQDSAKQSTT